MEMLGQPFPGCHRPQPPGRGSRWPRGPCEKQGQGLAWALCRAVTRVSLPWTLARASAHFPTELTVH